MLDLIALGFWSDSTRVSTFMIAADGSERHYTHLGISDGHHELSHHGRVEEKQQKIRAINRFQTEVVGTGTLVGDVWSGDLWLRGEGDRLAAG